MLAEDIKEDEKVEKFDNQNGQKDTTVLKEKIDNEEHKPQKDQAFVSNQEQQQDESTKPEK